MNFATIWEREVGDIILKVSFLKGHEGVIVASQGVVRMFDFDGEMQWRYQLKSDFLDLAALPNGSCTIACKDSLVFLDFEGNEEKEILTDREPVAVRAGERIGYLAGEELRILDLDGKPLIRASLDSEAKELAHHDLGFLVANQSLVESIDERGSTRWRKDIELTIDLIAAGGEEIYITSGKTLRKMGRDGKTIWSGKCPSPPKQICVGKFLFLLFENEVILLSHDTHEEVWKLKGEFSHGCLNKKNIALARNRTISFLQETGDTDVLYEIMCRGKERCGSFVSSRFLKQCPKCGAKKIILRVVRKKLQEKLAADSKDALGLSSQSTI